MAIASGNPAVKILTNAIHVEEGPAATIAGTVNKILIMLGMALLTATFTWVMFFKAVDAAGGTLAGPAAWSAGRNAVMPWMVGGIIGGLICSIAIWVKPTSAKITAPLFALCEGLFLGAISATFHAVFNKFPIVIQAAGLTFGTLAALLFAYKMGAIRATERFKAGVFAATGAVVLLYLVTMVLRLCGIQLPFIHQAGPIGIAISAVIVVIAALNLVIDFDLIEQAEAQSMPKVYEWVGAFALISTLVWLYLEILRLLAIIAASRE